MEAVADSGERARWVEDEHFAQVTGLYGWLGTDSTTTRRGNITNYVIGGTGIITYTITIGSGPALPAAGTKLSMRAARLNGSNSALNRTQVVEVVDATTVKTVERFGALPFTSAGTYVMTATSFLQYTGVQYTVLARRNPGRPFFHSPGRAPARARG